jgi:hypothetical protein
MKSFMAITFHYISNDFEMKSGLMDFIPIFGKHRGANIASNILKSFSDLGISKTQIFTATVDNATSNDAMLAILIDKG